MKINVRFFPASNPDELGNINYQIFGRNHDTASINTTHLIYRDEWNPYRKTIRMPRKASSRKSQLKEIANEIKCDIMQIQSIYDDYVDSGEKFRMVNVAKSFRSQRRSLSFFDFMYDTIDHLTAMNRFGTANNYITVLKSFMRFRENIDIELSAIDSDLMQRYEAYLNDRGVSLNTISFYMRTLRAVYNRAVDKELIPSRNPFRHVYTGIAKTIKRALPLKALQRIRTLNLDTCPSLDFARDMFMFSFYTRGMSFIDMAYIKESDIKYNTLYYRRHKTGQQLQIRWERPMQELIDKYKSITVAPYLLPICKSADEPRTRYKNTMARVNKSLKLVGKLANIEAPLTMYVARHSWANVARDQRVPISIISQGMGHDSELTTQIYLASISNIFVDKANSRIISKLHGPSG